MVGYTPLLHTSYQNYGILWKSISGEQASGRALHIERKREPAFFVCIGHSFCFGGETKERRKKGSTSTCGQQAKAKEYKNWETLLFEFNLQMFDGLFLLSKNCWCVGLRTSPHAFCFCWHVLFFSIAICAKREFR